MKPSEITKAIDNCPNCGGKEQYLALLKCSNPSKPDYIRDAIYDLNKWAREGKATTTEFLAIHKIKPMTAINRICTVPSLRVVIDNEYFCMDEVMAVHEEIRGQ